jgi:hypothetical protein
LILASLLDFINFSLAILFYILAKSIFKLVIFREALGVALRWLSNVKLCSKLHVIFFIVRFYFYM